MDNEYLILQHQDLAYSIAHKYKDLGVPLDDLKQEGLLGLLQAAGKFDPSQGNQFSTYATFWIKKRILEALQREGKSGLRAGELEEAKLESVPASELLQEEELNLPDSMPEQEKRLLSLSFGEKLSIKEISVLMGIPAERVKQLRQKALRRLRSILAHPPDGV